MKPRHRPLVVAIGFLCALFLSGSELQPVPFAQLEPIPPPEYTRVLERLESLHTGLAAEEIAAVSRAIVLEARAAQLDPELILAVIQVESSGDRMAISRVGALGLMQLLPDTARFVAHQTGLEWDGEASLFDPIWNVRLGVTYLQSLVDRFGSLDTALAAYNWGPTHIARQIRRRGPIPEAYTRRVLDVYDALI